MIFSARRERECYWPPNPPNPPHHLSRVTGMGDNANKEVCQAEKNRKQSRNVRPDPKQSNVTVNQRHHHRETWRNKQETTKIGHHHAPSQRQRSTKAPNVQLRSTRIGTGVGQRRDKTCHNTSSATSEPQRRGIASDGY